MADEALHGFTFLLENVPQWIAGLENILKASTAKQNEILFENQPADSPPVIKRRGSKSSSLWSRLSNGSKRDSHGVEEKEKDKSAATALLRPQLPHMTDSDALRLSQRKRKTASVCSGDQSGPHKYRSRAMVVVYYDGDTQKKFETLVRGIGSSRNAIRKGKMGAKVDNLSRPGSSSSSEGNISGGEESIVDAEGKMSYRSARDRSTRAVDRLFGKNNPSIQAFDRVDALMEKAQTLCERAAHQILRDGDCASELQDARLKFSEASRLAEAELPTLKNRVEKAAERQRRSDERRREQERAKKNRLSDGLSIQQVPSLVSSIPSETKLEVDLEADDSEGEGAEEPDFVLSTLGLGKYGMRSARLVAH